MVGLIIGMLICIGLAVAVVGLVAVPARREGRDVLTPRGEEVVAAIRAQATGTDGEPQPREATTAAGNQPTSADASRADEDVESEGRERTQSRAS
jgi:hypothetical protein